MVNQVCTRCVMDSSAQEITFDSAGICSFCTRFLKNSSQYIFADADLQQARLAELVVKIKRRGRRKRYDCVIGVSGGIDSSWVLVKAVQLGLRPLAVHMDNGWNSELAQNNIANLVRGLGVDLQTHVINWTEYKGLMQAFFDADVIDVELLYDNAMLAVNYRQAAKIGVRYMLSGANQVTEGMEMPKAWAWNKFDRRNIRSIARRNRIRMATFPSIGIVGKLWWGHVIGIQWVWFLDLLPFNKFDAMSALQRDFGYKPYPYKHYESIFTRFYQGFILPTKFGVDKRRVHFSTLVISGQMTRDQAIEGLRGIAYPSADALEEDKTYFMKKMGWSQADLSNYLGRPAQPHCKYGSERRLFDLVWQIRNYFRGVARSS